MRRWIAFAAVLMVPGMLGAQQGKGKAKLTAPEVVDRVQAFYADTDAYRAKFRQHYTNKTFVDTTESDGRVYIKKPGKMRWDYYEVVRGKKTPQRTKSFVSDGDKLWAVQHQDKQILARKLDEDVLPVAVTFLSGKGDLKADFVATLETRRRFDAQPGEIVLRLVPKAPSARYTTLWLVVNPSNFRVRRSVVLEASGNTNAFTFYEPNTRAKLADGTFAPNVKALLERGYRVRK